MKIPSRLAAVLVYLVPFVGWLYVFFYQRKNELALYHLRQSVGLFLFLVTILVGWAVVAWILVWIPYFGVLSAALLTMVIAAYFFGVVAWILGVVYALRNRTVPLPGIGRWVNLLPVPASK